MKPTSAFSLLSAQFAPILPFEPEPTPFGQAPFATVVEREDDNVIVAQFGDAAFEEESLLLAA